MTDDYEHVIQAINRPTNDLFAYARRTRRSLWLVGISLVVDLALTGGILHANQTEHRHNLDLKAQLCQQANNFRKGDLTLWDRVIALGEQDQSSLTPAQRRLQAAQRKSFKAFLVKHDALIECKKK